MARPREIPVGTLVDLPDPSPEPWEIAADAEAGERRPRYLVGMLLWTAYPALAAGYRGGVCPHCQDRLPPPGAACAICSGTRNRPKGVPMQRSRAARAGKARTRKERRAG